ncbi:DUF4097 family beta strand repeat-containing protein [Streptomyces capoamus]|uniref:DUF4097 family beta strand repeat-containing protein n=1 Tax=Streptomyces capoamus TaxID=68183 RepID=UPI003C2BE87C
MPVYATPKPILATVELDIGSLRFVAEDRSDTVVDVRPVDAARPADVKIAQQTTVEYADGRLVVAAPKQRPVLGRGGGIEITVTLPAGSQVEASAGWADVSSEGRLADCTVTTVSGTVHLDEAGPLWLTTDSGDITASRAHGRTQAASGSGSLRFHVLEDSAVLRTKQGSTTVGDALADLTVDGANGDITVDRAEGSVTARTTHGTVRVGEAVRGSLVLEVASTGSIEIGVREGSTARLHLTSVKGRVHNALSETDEPVGAGERVEVRARTKHGGIDVRRVPSRAA